MALLPFQGGALLSPKKIVSISLGSKKRDKSVTVELLGQTVQIERRGTDGDVKQARALISELDGKVAAFGLGGIDRYWFLDDRRYTVKSADRLAAAAKITPVVDGSGLKNTLERMVVHQLDSRIGLKDKKVLLVSSIDRFGMADALMECGADVLFADLMFVMGMPIPVRKFKTIKRIARMILPIAARAPIKWYYPTGKKQQQQVPKYKAHYEWAEILAGDFHYIKQHAPSALPKKVILTNTITEDDVKELKESGASLLVTTTPNMNGRSFGTNVMEAMIIAMAEKHPDDMSPVNYKEWIKKLGIKPHIQVLDGD